VTERAEDHSNMVIALTSEILQQELNWKTLNLLQAKVALLSYYASFGPAFDGGGDEPMAYMVVSPLRRMVHGI